MAAWLQAIEPWLASLLVALVWGQPLGGVLLTLVTVALLATVLVAIHHAEVIALRVGEPLGTLVLLPETWAAVRAALRNRMQTSFNLALGSALATIGLSIPAVVATAMAPHMPLTLGLGSKETVLLALALLISTMNLSPGRATVLQGAVHLVLFAVFLFLPVVP